MTATERKRFPGRRVWDGCATLVIVAAAVALVWHNWSSLRDAWWYVTDDYRWPRLVGPDGRLTFAEFLANCNPPDWPMGGPVNRPTYFSSTSLCMFLFGTSVPLWNYAREALMIVSLSAIGWVVWRLSWLLLGLGAIALVGLQGLWIDALLRWQSESFALLGLSLTLLFSYLCLTASFATRGRGIQRLLLAALTCAAIYATGAKENITVLLLGVAAVAFALSFRPEFPALARIRIPALLTLLFAAFVTGCIVKGVLLQGVDLYGNSVRGESPALQALAWIPSARWILGCIAGTLLVAGCYRLASRRQPNPDAPRIAPWLLAQLLILAYGAFQIYFYRGNIPPNSRYEFPLVFLPLCSVLVLCAYLGRLPFRRRWPKALVIHAFFAVFLVLSLRGRDLYINRTVARTYSAATIRFRTDLMRLVSEAKRDPARPVLFQSHRLNDTEPLASIEIFMRAYGATNPIYLELVGYSKETATSPSEANLYNLTTAFITKGTFLDAADLPPGSQPIIAHFSNADLSDGAVGNFWPLY